MDIGNHLRMKYRELRDHKRKVDALEKSNPALRRVAPWLYYQLVLFPTLFVWVYYTYEIKGAEGLTLSGLALVLYVCINLGATWVYAAMLDAILKEAERDGSLELLLEA